MRVMWKVALLDDDNTVLERPDSLDAIPPIGTAISVAGKEFGPLESVTYDLETRVYALWLPSHHAERYRASGFTDEQVSP